MFDKTGTLTNGKFEFVTCEHNHCHCKDNQHRELLKIIAACERYSNHPIAKSINVAFGHYADECEVKDSKTVLVSYHANDPNAGMSTNKDLCRTWCFSNC